MLLISKRSTLSVTVNTVLLEEVLNFLPVDLINGYQHKVLELYHMYTHFWLGLVKQSKKLTVSEALMAFEGGGRGYKNVT